ncbi:MAG: hypothetical protein IT564_08925 [Rhodospirillales bacterium]|nr:hypothetical protein [Rhodospirillales bacterium]
MNAVEGGAAKPADGVVFLPATPSRPVGWIMDYGNTVDNQEAFCLASNRAGNATSAASPTKLMGSSKAAQPFQPFVLWDRFRYAGIKREELCHVSVSSYRAVNIEPSRDEASVACEGCGRFDQSQTGADGGVLSRTRKGGFIVGDVGHTGIAQSTRRRGLQPDI